MHNREFFNQRAFDWDIRCKHDDMKINKIIDMSSIKEHCRILDVGTGTGILIKYFLSKNPKEIVGVDISENMIEMAKSKYSNSKVRFVVSDIMEFNEVGFDYIFLYSVYPHIAEKELLFNHLSSLLNTNGKIIIAHSEGRKQINDVHAKYVEVKNHRLLPIDETSHKMNRNFKISKMIDNDDLYYISGIKA